MSFDLRVYPPSGPATLDEVHRLAEAYEAPPAKGYPPPAPEMASFLAELERGWPSFEHDIEASPWSSWPLWRPITGGGTDLNIRWPHADTMLAAILEIAARTNVIVFDPQSGQVFLPSRVAADAASSSTASRQEAARSAREGMNFAAQVMRELGLSAKGEPGEPSKLAGTGSPTGYRRFLSFRRPGRAHGMVLPPANRRNATEHPDLAGWGPRQRTTRTYA
jgi:hypothetical protein